MWSHVFHYYSSSAYFCKNRMAFGWIFTCLGHAFTCIVIWTWYINSDSYYIVQNLTCLFVRQSSSPWSCYELAVLGRSRCGALGINSRWKIDIYGFFFPKKENYVCWPSLLIQSTQIHTLVIQIGTCMLTISDGFIKVFIYRIKEGA